MLYFFSFFCYKRFTELALFRELKKVPDPVCFHHFLPKVGIRLPPDLYKSKNSQANRTQFNFIFMPI
nr:MAG TPA: hypothetical protein [Caudoviricetes sp.]